MVSPLELLAQIVNFIILLFLMHRLLYKPVRKFLDERTASIENQLNDAKEQQAAAEKLRASLEEKLQSAESEAQEMIDQAVRRAESRSREIHDDLVAKAKDEVARMQRNAEEELKREKEKAWQELKDTVVQLSFDVASKVAQASIDQSHHQKLISEVTSKLDHKALSNDQ